MVRAAVLIDDSLFGLLDLGVGPSSRSSISSSVRFGKRWSSS